ncbi:lipid-A-disaccharide synthase [Devosia nitrariae]|uniref:Lipid-A-disaccharide synthase n=1 Tax=Devosia nitrariae TaxID=2071872 RepID=A0ABQ5WDZ9_9HYPH|nr:lipid-A-disaccharide synthase [Devosia nitrariae]GLQ57811.1 lipid-A-disaccharide synthase [Devosia nitrariae]
MSEPLELFILAGEPSGDRIGADLVRRLRERATVELAGVGGDELAAEGLASLYPMQDLAVMGITDVLRRLPLLLWRVEETVRAIVRSRPDVVVLIDAQEFSRLVAGRLRARQFDRPVLLYVAPSVWARSPHRAARIKPLFDEVLAVLPFEPAVMRELGGPPTSYVGHPALAEIGATALSDTGLVALLPGSRQGELRRHLPLMRTVAEALAGDSAVDGFLLPALPALAEMLAAETADWPVSVEIVADRGRRAELYARTVLAISVAGTATLELALAGVPMVTTYVMDGHQARVFGKLGRPAVGLPNIILDRLVIPEIISRAPQPAAVIAAARDLLDDRTIRQDQADAFGELARLMTHGAPEAARQDPAERVLAHWHR